MLAGCSSAIDMIPNQVGGLLASAPARPEQPPEYPNIYATPAPRESRPLTEEEQKDLEKELSEIRDRQTGARRPQGRSGRTEPAESTPKNRSP